MLKTIYVLDDESDILDLIRKYLEKEGYSVAVFSDAEELLRQAERELPHMFILDIMLPGEMDGFELCRRLRQLGDTPIIFVSAKSEELDRILGLELGADDYLSKPFSPRELVARVKTIFRRMDSLGRKQKLIEHKGVRVFPEERRIVINGREADFTAKEFELLALLLKNINRAFSRQELLDLIWGYDYVGDIRAVDDLVKRVRKKLREHDSPVVISTVWGYGYKIAD